MRFLVSSLCLVLTACGSYLPDLVSNPSTREEVPISATVALVDWADGTPYCTGVVTPQGILTAAHCVDEEKFVNVALYTDLDLSEERFRRSYMVSVLQRNAGCDLALVAKPFSNIPDAPIANRPPSVGETIHIVGMPMGFPYTVHRGIVSGPIRNSNNGVAVRWFQVDAGVFPGNSGGPVFSADGEVLGIVSFGVTMHGVFLGTLGMAVPTNNLSACW